jgi:hypothetical protein
MKLTDDLKDARLSVVRTAELVNMHPAHFRRLCRRGVFPKAKRTATGRPYFDYGLLAVIAKVLRTGVGNTGHDIMFYRRRPRSRVTTQLTRNHRPQTPPDPCIQELAGTLRQMGIPKNELHPENLNATLNAIFGKERPDLGVAIPAVARKLWARARPTK